MDISHILNLQPNGISELTGDTGHYLYFNDKEIELRQTNAEALKKTSVFALIPTDYSAHLQKAFAECLSSPEGFEFFFNYQDNDHHYQMRLVKHGNNILSTLSDVTSAHRLQAQASKDQQTIKCLNDAVNGANIGCWDFYPQEGRIIANSTWVTQKKYPDTDFRESDEIFSEVIDGLNRWASIVHPDDLDATVELIEKHLNGETEVYDAKFRMKCGDGKWRWIHDIGKVFQRDEQGNAIRMNGVHIDISVARELEKRIAKLAVTDSLTGVLNRRNFEELSLSLLEQALQEQTYFCILLLDIDHFKQYNDTYGHAEGDQVLKQISQTLKDNTRRGNDYCFRMGGEEFAVIFTDTSKESAKSLAIRIKQQIENLAIPHQHNAKHRCVTISAGLSCSKGLNGIKSVNTVYEKTDRLLYQAKKAGRNLLICD